MILDQLKSLVTAKELEASCKYRLHKSYSSMWYMVWLIGVSLSRGTALGEDTDDKYDEIFQKMMVSYKL